MPIPVTGSLRTNLYMDELEIISPHCFKVTVSFIDWNDEGLELRYVGTGRAETYSAALDEAVTDAADKFENGIANG